MGPGKPFQFLFIILANELENGCADALEKCPDRENAFFFVFACLDFKKNG
jgi:hypothetical protein